MGDWHSMMSPDEPYDLLFMDAMPGGDLVPSKWDAVIDLVKIGGQMVMDDLTPVSSGRQSGMGSLTQNANSPLQMLVW